MQVSRKSGCEALTRNLSVNRKLKMTHRSYNEMVLLARFTTKSVSSNDIMFDFR